MSSDLFVFDGSTSSSLLNHHSSSPDDTLVSSAETEFLFADHEFSPFSDSAIDILQALSDHQNPTIPTQTQTQQQNPETNENQISPSSQGLQSLTLYNIINNQTASDLPNGLGDYFHVKTEQCQVGIDFDANNGFYSQNLPFGPHSYSDGGIEDVAKLIQRSFSSNSFEQKPSSSPSSLFSFSPRFDALLEPQAYQSQALSLSSPETGFLSGQMRRVCSTGDLQNYGTVRTTQRSLSSPLEEANFKVGKYSAEERKERISKYKAKRTLRNFNKTIKYACRKTLADNRPRIRGRFARNDEPLVGGDIPKAPSSSSSSRPDDYYDDDEFWLEGLNEEEEDTDQTVRGQFLNSYGSTQFQYYGF